MSTAIEAIEEPPRTEEREGGTKFFDTVPKGIYNAGY